MQGKPLFWITVFFVLFTVNGCVTTPLSTGSGAQTSTPVPVLLDTDMGFDDWMSLLYLLKKPDVELKGISVDCTGETYCPQGADNVTKLLKLVGAPSIPIYYGDVPERTREWQFPKMIRKGATDMAVPGFEKLEGTGKYSPGAAEQMALLIHQAGMEKKPLVLISIGTATNIADAIEFAKGKGDAWYNIFKAGISMVYKGGGAVGKAIGGKLTNQDIPGNIAIPKIYKSHNTTAAWNIFADAEAAEALVLSGLPITLIPVNLSGHVPIKESSYKQLQKENQTPAVKFVLSDILSNVTQQGGWIKNELDYWDPSVVIAALKPQLVTEKYDGVAACVDTSQMKKWHGTVWVKDPAERKCEATGSITGGMSVYTKIDVTGFYNEFFSVLGRP